MIRILFASVLIFGVASLAQASSPLPGDFGGPQIVEKKCKAGFKLNKQRNRCVAVARPSTNSGNSGGGSF